MALCGTVTQDWAGLCVVRRVLVREPQVPGEERLRDGGKTSCGTRTWGQPVSMMMKFLRKLQILTQGLTKPVWMKFLQ